MTEDELYQMAVDELNSDKRDLAVWKHACQLSGGDHDEARYLYTTLRVEEMEIGQMVPSPGAAGAVASQPAENLANHMALSDPYAGQSAEAGTDSVAEPSAEPDDDLEGPESPTAPVETAGDAMREASELPKEIPGDEHTEHLVQLVDATVELDSLGVDAALHDEQPHEFDVTVAEEALELAIKFPGQPDTQAPLSDSRQGTMDAAGPASGGVNDDQDWLEETIGGLRQSDDYDDTLTLEQIEPDAAPPAGLDLTGEHDQSGSSTSEATLPADEADRQDEEAHDRSMPAFDDTDLALINEPAPEPRTRLAPKPIASDQGHAPYTAPSDHDEQPADAHLVAAAADNDDDLPGTEATETPATDPEELWPGLTRLPDDTGLEEQATDRPGADTTPAEMPEPGLDMPDGDALDDARSTSDRPGFGSERESGWQSAAESATEAVADSTTDSTTDWDTDKISDGAGLTGTGVAAAASVAVSQSPEQSASPVPPAAELDTGRGHWYALYQRPTDLTLQPVKLGLSWPALFATLPWALWHRLWGTALLHLLVGAVAAVLLALGALHWSDAPYRAAGGLPAAAWWFAGFAVLAGYALLYLPWAHGNRWVRRKLEQRGFSLHSQVRARSPGHALRAIREHTGFGLV